MRDVYCAENACPVEAVPFPLDWLACCSGRVDVVVGSGSNDLDATVGCKVLSDLAKQLGS